MHTVELLEQALAAAQAIGLKVRQDWLGGTDTGWCEIKGQKCIFLDVAQSPADQLGPVLDALRGDPRLSRIDLPAGLATVLQVRRSA